MARRPALRFLAFCSIATVLVAIVAVWMHASWLPRLASWLDVGQPFQHVDVVMALPGDSERRPFVAAALVNVGLADEVLIVSTAPTTDLIDAIGVPEHVLTQRIYTARGVPAERIRVLEGRSSSTIHDTRQLAAHLTRQREGTAGIVTNAYHTRRTRWTLDHRLPELADRIKVFSAPNPGHINQWWRNPKGFQAVSSEYLKLAAYVFYYRSRWIDVALFTVALLILLPRLLAIFSLHRAQRARRMIPVERLS